MPFLLKKSCFSYHWEWYKREQRTSCRLPLVWKHTLPDPRTMKVAIFLLVLIPLTIASQDKRFFLETFGLDINVLKNTVQDLLDQVGSDSSEQTCEAGCHGVIMGSDTTLLHTLCTPICRSLQTLAGLFNLRPQSK